MNCHTGLGVLGQFAHYLPMKTLSSYSCALFDAVKHSTAKTVVAYNQLMCELTKKQVNGTFQTLQDEFCSLASKEIKQLATNRDTLFFRYYLGAACYIGGIGAVFLLSSSLARKNGYVRIAHVMKVSGVATIGIGVVAGCLSIPP